jgi:hypothetical protein
MENVTSPSEQPANSEPKDIRADMLSFVEKGSDIEDENPESPESNESEEKQEEDNEDSEEDSSKDDEESKDEEKDDDDSEPKKKKNRYQKQKAKIEALSSTVKTVTTQRDEAIKIAYSYRTKLEAVIAKYKKDFETFKSGNQLSEAEQKLWLLETKNKEKEQMEQLQVEQEKERIKQDILLEKEEMKVQFQTEALSHAKRFGLSGDEAKIFARKILLYTATETEAGREISLEEVANDFGQIFAKKKTGSLNKQQSVVNKSTPRTFSSKSGKVPSFDLQHKDPDEDKRTMLAFLESTGKV